MIHNPLAKVVTIEMNFLLGGNEAPAALPGMAQEHMAFRGCQGMSADQTSAIYAQPGGKNNADTQQNITQLVGCAVRLSLDEDIEAIQRETLRMSIASRRSISPKTTRLLPP